MEFVKCDYSDLGYNLRLLKDYDIKFVTEAVDNGRFTYTIFYMERGK